MELKARQQFTCGTVKTVLFIDSRERMSNSIADQLFAAVQTLVNEDIVPACSALVTDGDCSEFSRVNYTVSANDGDITFIVEIHLTVRQGGLKAELLSLLGRHLSAIGNLHDLAGHLTAKEQHPSNFMDDFLSGIAADGITFVEDFVRDRMPDGMEVIVTPLLGSLPDLLAQHTHRHHQPAGAGN